MIKKPKEIEYNGIHIWFSACAGQFYCATCDIYLSSTLLAVKMHLKSNHCWDLSDEQIDEFMEQFKKGA